MDHPSASDRPPDGNLLPLVGREKELQLLSNGLEGFLAGRGCFFLISGEAGMGKSRLTAWVADRARERGAVTLWGRCWESVDTPAYWPWRQVVRTLLDRLGEDAPRLIGSAGPAIARMVPEVGDLVDEAGSTTRFEEFDALASFLKKTSEKIPLVLVFEDIHAADESSLLMLQFLARDVIDASLLIIATRDTSTNVPRDVEAAAADIERDAHVVSLAGIDEDAISQVYESVAAEKPAAAIVAAIHRATEGNPLFVLEAIRMLTEKGDLHRPDHSVGFRVPAGVRDMMRRRVAGLPAEDTALLSIASVIGREFDVPVLEAVSGIDQGSIFDMLDRAVASGIVVEAGLGRYRFTHILIRETLYEDLSSSQRMRTHAEVGRCLEETFDADDRLPELAHHWFKSAQAGDPRKALEYTVKAADQAAAQGAHEEAARLYQRALTVAQLAQTPRGSVDELEASLGNARLAAGAALPHTETSAYRFSKEGEFWTIVYQNQTTRLKDSKGLRLIARLLERPGRETHVLDLLGPVEGRTIPRARADEALSSDAFSDVGPALDPTAKSAYKRRLVELQQEIDEAETFNDPERAARAREEMDALIDQLSGAIGIGGRDRKVGSTAERARVSTTKAIKEAIKKVAENDAGLGAHFTTAIKTGTYCAYMPDPRAPIEWEMAR